MYHFLIVVCLQVLTSTLVATSSCLGVNQCDCDSNNNHVNILCKEQSLTKVPAFSHSDIQYHELTLADNLIQNIDDNAFIGLIVYRLDLTGNPLMAISNAAFAGLENTLRELLLGLDSRAVFPSAALAQLTNLIVLEVKGFGGTSLPSGALAPLVNLQYLALTYGFLQTLVANDLAGKLQLSYLSLEHNKLTAVPKDALSSAPNLITLIMNQNPIKNIMANTFSTAPKLQMLDLSQTSIGDGMLEAGAFSGLEFTLTNLTMKSCHLDDGDVRSLTNLKALLDLNIIYNDVTNINAMLGGMSSLRKLNVESNKVIALGASTFLAVGNSLQILSLANNPLNQVHPEAFSPLTALQELYLDSAMGLKLTVDTFAFQRQTLHTLSLKSALLNTSQWSAISNLAQLQTLQIPKCNLGDIPDFMFSGSGQLQTIDMSGNGIDNITQRSLSGLQNSLVSLKMNNNSLTTLDECVFYQFQRLDLSLLSLANNPLQCDCRIKWLYTQMKQAAGESSSLLHWTCANLGGKMFSDLSDSDFACDTSAGPVVCENLLPTSAVTTTSSTDSTASPIFVTISNVSDTSALVSWSSSVSASDTIIQLRVTYRIRDSQLVAKSDRATTDTSYTLTELKAATAYVVCVEMATASTPTFVVKSCVDLLTFASSSASTHRHLPTDVIIGISIGCILMVIIIVAVVIAIYCVKSRRSGEARVISSPKPTTVTKVYKKPSNAGNEYRRPLDRSSSSVPLRHTDSSVRGSDADEYRDRDISIVDTLNMSPLEKERVKEAINVLSQSREFLNLISGSGTYRPSYGDMSTFPFPSSRADRHIYEEIPDDDHYDTIPGENVLPVYHGISL